MSRISAPIEIVEISGDCYPDLETAQKLALVPLAGDLAATLRGLLEAGKLTIEDGRIVVTPSKNGDAEHG